MATRTHNAAGRRRSARCGALGLVLLTAACGADDTASVASTTVAETAGDATIPVPPPTSTTMTPVEAGIVNTWSTPPVDLTRLPLGDAFVSVDGASVGGLYLCSAGLAAGAGAFRAGPWIDQAAGTWDATAKVPVQGRVDWPMARYSESIEGDMRVIASSGLPVGHVTGTFPIAATDPAFAYDRNPNAISEQDLAFELPLAPEVSAEPTCLPWAGVAIMRNGVLAFASVDERGRDAVAWETQDECHGHPQQVGAYHYHDVPTCIVAASEGPSTVVGFALDGFPIVVERDAAGRLPTNADLDECHGRTSAILLDGEVIESYHYSATREFPYFIGCFRGAPAS